MSTKVNILLTSAGQRVSLLRSFQESLRSLGIDGKIGAADMRRDAPTMHVADFSVHVPSARDAHYTESLLEACREHRVSLVIPLIDPELPVLAACRKEFEKEGVRVVVSSERTTEIAEDKRNTGAFLIRSGFETPRLLDLENGEPAPTFPVVIKPADGSSGQSFYRVSSKAELDFYRRRVPNPIIQEFVEGQEYTLDVLADFRGVARCVVPRRRIETRAGESVKGATERDWDLIDLGRRVVDALPGAMGCITVQCFRSPDGTMPVIEINPRFGGGFPLSYAAGALFPRWIIEMHLGMEPLIELAGWRDGLAMLRYYDAVVVENEDLTWR